MRARVKRKANHVNHRSVRTVIKHHSVGLANLVFKEGIGVFCIDHANEKKGQEGRELRCPGSNSCKSIMKSDYWMKMIVKGAGDFYNQTT